MTLRYIAHTAITASAIAAAISMAATPPIQISSAGSVHRHYIYSPQLNDTVTIDVWTPRGYNPERQRKYPVIFMHDGQNLFDSATTWNHQAWDIDNVADSLIAIGEIEAPIVVGIHSVQATRVTDLAPQKPIEEDTLLMHQFTSAFGNSTLRGDAYANFMANTLLPWASAEYNIAQTPDRISVMGSSMGGLMSIYALCRYPQIFGNAACLSTHWIGIVGQPNNFPEAMRRYLRQNIPVDGKHSIYLDRGTKSLDSLYAADQDSIIYILHTKGYREPYTMMTLTDSAGSHEEASWKRRVHIPLCFLLGSPKH